MVTILRKIRTWLREHIVDTLWEHGVAIIVTALVTSAATAAITSTVVVEHVRSVIAVSGPADCGEWPGCPVCVCCPPCGEDYDETMGGPPPPPTGLRAQ